MIYVDYQEESEIVFRRATARAYNDPEGGSLMGELNFHFESRLRAGKTLTTPSWPLHLAFSNSL